MLRMFPSWAASFVQLTPVTESPPVTHDSRGSGLCCGPLRALCAFLASEPSFPGVCTCDSFCRAAPGEWSRLAHRVEERADGVLFPNVPRVALSPWVSVWESSRPAPRLGISSDPPWVLRGKDDQQHVAEGCHTISRANHQRHSGLLPGAPSLGSHALGEAVSRGCPSSPVGGLQPTVLRASSGAEPWASPSEGSRSGCQHHWT